MSRKKDGMDEFTRKQYEIEAALKLERERLRCEQSRRDYLNGIQHGHNWGDNRRCRCGQGQSLYHVLPESLREVCRLAIARQAGSPHDAPTQ
jgi:hypothetical protein